MTQAILDGLRKLDVTNDQHWTQDGLASINILKILASLPTLTREQVEAAAPGFSRTNTDLPGDPASLPPVVTPAPEQGTDSAAPAAQSTPLDGVGQPEAMDFGGKLELDESLDIDELEEELSQALTAQLELAEYIRKLQDKIGRSSRHGGSSHSNPNAALEYSRAMEARVKQKSNAVKELLDAGIAAKTIKAHLAAPIDKPRNR